MTLSITIQCDTQDSDTWHKDTRYNDTYRNEIQNSLTELYDVQISDIQFSITIKKYNNQHNLMLVLNVIYAECHNEVLYAVLLF